MFSMIKPTLAAAMVLASASLALAEPGGPASHHEWRQRGTVQFAPTGALRSAPARLYQGRNPVRGGQQDEISIDFRDRASSPYAPGVGN